MTTHTVAVNREHLCMSQNWHPIDLTIDHIIPVSIGGTTTMDNLRTVCRHCHVRQQRR